MRHDRGRDQAGAEDADLGPGAGVAGYIRDRVIMLRQQPQRCQRCEQDRQRLLGQQTGDRDRNDQ